MASGLELKTYYCYACDKTFKTSLAFYCCICSSDCIEELSSSSSRDGLAGATVVDITIENLLLSADLTTDNVLFDSEYLPETERGLTDDFILANLLDSIALSGSSSNINNQTSELELVCHVCDVQFGSSSAANPTCPVCNSGFVQQISDLHNEILNNNETELEVPLLFIPEEREERVSSEQTAPSPQCPICYEDYSSGDRTELRCHHIFHRQCIETWMQRRRNCPICRVNV